jgi:ATP-binding protein involved in chromosome partitioning
MSGDIFGRGGAEAEASRLAVAYLGDLPLAASVREGGDAGKPVVLSQPESEAALRFGAVAASVAEALGLN